MSYTHGVYISEAETAITAPVTGYSGLPVCIGTSAKGPANTPTLITRYEEGTDIFGSSSDWEACTINEFLYMEFALYGQSPVVIIRASEAGAQGIIDALGHVGEVFHKYRLVPGIILAPGWSHLPEVAAVMSQEASKVSGVFRCISICDAPGDSYADIPSWKTSKNYVSSRQILCWPKVKLGTRAYHMSCHLCGVMNATDNSRGDVPYKTPSNEILQCEGCVNDAGDEVLLTLEQANYLNGQGVVTALNWTGGWRVWGNNTCAYPANTDPKDRFIPVRRMFDYIGNTFINTFWQKADQPMTIRLIREVVNSFNLYLNGLAARDMILGGRIEFRENENVLTDLMNGILRFHVFVTPPVPAETIEGILEYDPDYLSALYEAVRG